MNIWILSKKDDLEDYSLRRLYTEFLKAENKVEIINPIDLDIFVNANNKKSIMLKGEYIELPDFVIPRTGSSTDYFDFMVIRHLERMNIPMLNSSDSIEKSKDKLYSIQVLAENNVPIPKTLLGKNPIDVDFIEKRIGFPLVIKTISGAYGKGVFLAETKKQFVTIIEILENIAPNYTLVIQEFISESHGQDLRVFVLDEKVIAVLKRTATDGDFRANIFRGGVGEIYEVNKEIEEISVNATKALGLNFSGVDLLFSKNGFKVCEVNSSPQFEVTEKNMKNLSIPNEILKYFNNHLINSG